VGLASCSGASAVAAGRGARCPWHLPLLVGLGPLVHVAGSGCIRWIR